LGEHAFVIGLWDQLEEILEEPKVAKGLILQRDAALQLKMLPAERTMSARDVPSVLLVGPVTVAGIRSVRRTE
jgi:hypothetical protein